MSGYRVELRIFGLLVFALIATTILYVGLSAADVKYTPRWRPSCT